MSSIFSSKKKLFVLCSIFLALAVFPFRAQGASLTYRNSEVPVIHPRSAWETSGLRSLFSWFPGEGTSMDKKPPPAYSSVERIVIHHSATKLKGRDPKKVIRAVFKYHALTRGWGDIGYHYLITPEGTIYQGRYGGNGVRAAHVFERDKCDNHNFHTVGISVLGNYSDSQPPEEAYQSLSRLVAWISATNGLDLEKEEKQTEVWNYEIKNSDSESITKRCDLTSGQPDKTFTGPVLLGHNDIDKENTCPGEIKMDKIREQAGPLVDKFQSYLYTTKQKPGEQKNGYWNFEEGIRKKADDERRVGKKVISLNDNQLLYYPQAQRPDLSSGMLVKSKTRERLYVVQKEDGKLVRKSVLSPALLKEHGLKNRSPRSYPVRELVHFPVRGSLLYPEETLLTTKDTDRVYLIRDKKKRLISSPSLYDKLGLDKDEIKKVPSRVLAAHPTGKPLYLEDGTLIKGDDSPAVYKIENNKKRPIVSARAFNSRSFDWKDIMEVSSQELALYEKGRPVLSSGKSFVKKYNSPRVFYVKKGYKNWVTGPEVFQAIGGQWDKVVSLSQNLLSLFPQGGEIASTADLKEIASFDSDSTTTKKEETQDKKENKEGRLPTQEQEIAIRIAKLDGDSDFVISADKAYSVLGPEGLKKEKLAGERYKIPLSKLEQYLKFKITESEQGIFKVISYEDHPRWKPSLNDNQFRGRIKVVKHSGTYYLVNVLKMENYLKGIAEALSSNDSLEFLKTMAVAARSYAYFYLNQDKYPDKPYDLTNLTRDQLYKGYGYEKRASKMVKAVNKTKGEILTYNNKVAIAPYSSDSGGQTVNACDKWGYCKARFDYLKGGIQDPKGVNHNPKNVKKSHGVGMSNIGARKMAEKGTGYRGILSHYYPGTKVKELY